MRSELYTLQKWLAESDNIVFISGQDFSREAGFPDYRRMEARLAEFADSMLKACEPSFMPEDCHTVQKQQM